MTALIAGNLYTIEQQSHDTVAAWRAKSSLLADGVTTAANTTLTYETTTVKDAPGAVRLTAVAAGTVSATTGYTAVNNVPAGATLHLYAHKYATKTGRSLKILVNWADAADALISQSNLSTTGTDTINAFEKFVTANVTSPSIAGGSTADTAQVEVVYTFTGLGADEYVIFDTNFFGPPPAASVQSVTPGSVASAERFGSLTVSAPPPGGPVVLVRTANTYERRKLQRRNATNTAYVWE